MTGTVSAPPFELQTGAAVVDTDVHCAPKTFDELSDFLDPYWQSYLADSGLSLSPSQGGAYPPMAPTSATPAARAAGTFPPSTVDELRAQLLDSGPRRTALLDCTVSFRPAALLNCTVSFHCNRNPYFEAALTRAVNDWLVTRWLERDDRLRASIVVPTLDAEAAVAEIERVGEHPGVVQVLLPVRTDAPWGNKRHRPLLRAAAERGLVVGLHAWGRIGNAASSTGFTHSYLEDYLANGQVLAQAQLTSLVTEGVFAQLPELRVAVLECGFSWLPTLLWRFDKDWKGVWREVPWVAERPSEIVRRHVRLTTAPAHLPRDPEQVREALDLLDAGSMLMYASDHPHDHGDGADRLLAALTDDERPRVLAGNATDWYRLDG